MCKSNRLHSWAWTARERGSHAHERSLMGASGQGAGGHGAELDGRANVAREMENGMSLYHRHINLGKR